MSIRVEISNEKGDTLAFWDVETSMPTVLFPGWLRNILTDEETFGLGIEDVEWRPNTTRTEL